MLARRPWLLLVVPFALSGCGVAPRVQSAFGRPVAPPTRPANRRYARQAPEFDSLSCSLGQLDHTTFDALIKRWNASPAKAKAPSRARAAFVPSLSPVESVRFLAHDSASSPLLPRGRAGDFGFSPTSFAPEWKTQNGAAPLQVVSPRTLRAFRSPPDGAAPSSDVPDGDARAFLEGWAARQSLSRTDEEFLGRRALNERIALLSRTPIPSVDLSLVPPDVQLELTNLRLQLAPLLSVSPAQKARAQQRINAIEARLRQIWKAETARQAQARRQTLEEVPARLAREGEAALQQNTRKQTRLDQEQRARVRYDLQRRLRFSAPAPLLVRQSAALAPDAREMRALLKTPFVPLPAAPDPAPMPLASDNAPLSFPQSASVGLATHQMAQQARVWREATRR